MDKYIKFAKPVEFLDIGTGEIFKVYEDYDEREYIQLKTKMRIYLTPKRRSLGYFEEVCKDGEN